MEADRINVSIGNETIGPDHPVLIQSMCNVPTTDTSACVEQCIRIFEAGGGLARMAARNIGEARNLTNIRRELNRKGFPQPICADVHFNPAIAMEAAGSVEKVRINPGNFAATGMEATFRELLEICRGENTAVRIGVNHGSLSEKIMEKYGDTPEGMVESALEYMYVCRREKFNNAVVSLKSSNTRIMVYANRLMKQRMDELKMHYPLHLGVTEAGEGEDGRIKSAAGIGTLLGEGLGDTIRVSLTEAPENEIPVARKLLQATGRKSGTQFTGKPGSSRKETHTRPTEYIRRISEKHEHFGGGMPPVVIAPQGFLQDEEAIRHAEEGPLMAEPDYYFVPDHRLVADIPQENRYILNAEAWILDDYPQDKVFPLFDLPAFLSRKKTSSVMNFLLLRQEELAEAAKCLAGEDIPLCLVYMHRADPSAREAFLELLKHTRLPIIVQAAFLEQEPEMFQIRAAAELAWYFIDGYADGVWLDNPLAERRLCMTTAFKILQASRSRMTETEYIACPSCARTLFDIQKTLAEVKASTCHLRHLKIAVMGCIVNGPGEMADADYGYVGSGKGKISLYRGRELMRKNIPQENAVEELILLIKEHGDWQD